MRSMDDPHLQLLTRGLEKNNANACSFVCVRECTNDVRLYIEYVDLK